MPHFSSVPGLKFSIRTSAVSRGEIEADRALVAVDADEIGRVVLVEGRAPVAHLVAGGRLDLDHVGAMVGENLGAIGTTKHAREIDDAQSAHCAQNGFSHAFASPVSIN
jgi:hypothetical protein